jgi:6-phosphogluconolactonase
MARRLAVVPTPGRLARVAAEHIADLASHAIAERGRFVVALSGGSTPRPTYRLLAQDRGMLAIDWSRVHVLWGDERCVPPDHPDSNYRMARRALLDHVRVPASQVHRVKGELPPQEAAAAYRAELAAVLGDLGDRVDPPSHCGWGTRREQAVPGERAGRFDLILLGLGSDGHTASLFPGTPAVAERRRDVVPVYVERLEAWRVTLTLPIINDARRVIFLVSGRRKADVLARVHAGGSTGEDAKAAEQLPAGLVQPTEGTLTWLVDRDAAAALSP